MQSTFYQYGPFYAIIIYMVEVPIVNGLKNFVIYKPSDLEKNQGLMSSVNSPGLVGAVNRSLAVVFRQQEADIKAFLDHWTHPLPT